MAKATKQKTLVEKVIEGADKILHPENHEAPQVEAETSEQGSELEAMLTKTKPKSEKSEIGKHQKFDKFK